MPQYSYAAFGLVVGRPDTNIPSTIRPRPAQEFVLRFNHYDEKQAQEHLEAYEAAYKTFREQVGLYDKTWRQAVVLSTAFSYMDGRENLRESVVARGFKLK